MYRLTQPALYVCASLLVLSGCEAPPPLAGGVDVSQNVTPQTRTMRPSPRNAPGNKALLYVVTDENFAFVADYPSGQTLHRISFGGNVNGTGICSNASGQVFMTAQAEQGTYPTGYIYEFAHGGTSPIATLEETGHTPTDCSVDPTTGNLAVTSTSEANCRGNAVAIYPGAKGTPTIYEAPGFACLAGAAYDDQGNLFLVGSGGVTDLSYVIEELPRGSSNLIDIALNEQLTCVREECRSAIQWYGKYLAITKPSEARNSPIVYRVQVSGSVGKVVGATTFHGNFGAGSGTGSLVRGGKILLTYRPNNVALWSYPAGGKAIGILKGFKGYPHLGLTVSQ